MKEPKDIMDLTVEELTKLSAELIPPYNLPPYDPMPGHKWVKNLMSNRWIEIPIDTPLCCDPSTETYWNM